MPHTAYIVECVRTAGGKKGGRLSGVHPVDLGASVLDEIVVRAGIDGSKIDEVIVGCVSQVGAQTGNIGRMMVLASKKIPQSVPGTSIDRQCGSSQQALHFACQAVMAGTHDCVIAAGVENMSQVPIGASIVDGFKAGHGQPAASLGIQANYGKGVQFSQFGGAELLAKKYNLTREELDKFGFASQKKGYQATKEGRFKREILPIKVTDKEGKEIVHDVDEGIRPEVNLEQMQKLKTLDPKGIITAATSSQICDGAAAVLVCNENGLKKLGLRPRARVVAQAQAGTDPIIMLEGPIPAGKKCLEKAGLKSSDIDIFEVNEAFAPVPVSFMKALGVPDEKMNVNGGACALGHPLGASGVKLMTTLVHELERRKGRYGMQAICEGGGTANATIIERVDGLKAKL